MSVVRMIRVPKCKIVGAMQLLARMVELEEGDLAGC